MGNGESLSPVNQEIRDWEINAYSKITKEDAARGFDSILLYNAPFVDFLVAFYNLKNKRILDYGCGLGTFCELFSNYSTDVSGCDISEEELKFAREKTNSSITYFQDDFFNSTLAENSYDFIFCRGLGPLVKIDYNLENNSYLKKLTSALRNEGVGYFILLGNLTGKPENRLKGFQNYRLATIYDFFKGAGYVSMINVFGYQAVIIARERESCPVE